MLQAICCATESETSERTCRRADKWKLQARTTVETCLLKIMVWLSVTPRSFKLSLTATQLSATRRCVGYGGVLYCTVQCTVCLVLLFLNFYSLYFEFYYNRRWFYLLILVTIIDLKQMLEVLTAQLLFLGVR